jgi:hypothetical protein
MTSIVYVLLFLGTKLKGDQLQAYTETLVFETQAACNVAKNITEKELKKKFDQIQIDCRKREIMK